MKIGLIREEKTPHDLRVAFTPKQCKKIVNDNPNISFVIQPSPHRCYSEQEYIDQAFEIEENLSNRDVLFGIKEIPIDSLIANKTYFTFSHTFKKQPYNQAMLQAIIKKNIRLIDYECLRNHKGQRLVGFGKFAGIVGTHNGLLIYGKKTNAFSIKRAIECVDYKELKGLYSNITIPPMKIVVTGSGRVATGVLEFLSIVGIKEVSAQDFLSNNYDKPVYTQLLPADLYRHKDTNVFVRKDFHQNPQNYICDFNAFTKKADLMINAIYWSPLAPRFFSKENMKSSDFNLKVIADISCDVNGSVPATIKTTDKNTLVFGYDVQNMKETEPYQSNTVDIMAVHNLPTELPKDASELFGNQLQKQIIPELLKEQSNIIDNATICKNGDLTEPFEYLRDYVEK